MSRWTCGTTGHLDEDGDPMECDEGGLHHCLRIAEEGQHFGAHRCCWCGRSFRGLDDD